MFVLVGSVVSKSQGIGCGLPLLRTFGFSSNTGPKAIEDTTTTSKNMDRRYIKNSVRVSISFIGGFHLRELVNER